MESTNVNVETLSSDLSFGHNQIRTLAIFCWLWDRWIISINSWITILQSVGSREPCCWVWHWAASNRQGAATESQSAYWYSSDGSLFKLFHPEKSVAMSTSWCAVRSYERISPTDRLAAGAAIVPMLDIDGVLQLLTWTMTLKWFQWLERWTSSISFRFAVALSFLRSSKRDFMNGVPFVERT